MALGDGTAGGGRIVTIGEILVEIMATEPGDGFRAPIGLIGPYPSGAPAIFIDQVAKLGQPCGIVGCVGDDDFGWVNIERLRQDGCDVSGIEIRPDQVTGSAFVRYMPSGDRNFVFNIRNSAAGQTRVTAAASALLADCAHLHVMGSSLSSPSLIRETKEAVAAVKGRGGSISFDPNVRKEILDMPGMREALAFMLAACDLFLPSGQELTMLTEARSEAAAIAELLDRGVSAIVLKRGAEGASYHDKTEDRRIAGFVVQEIDPTGAGDCFGGTFVTCRLQGQPVADCLRYAAASGALAVTKRGPMEGTATFAELDALIGAQS
jgi:sugar/nucleoside kinase (ribokinase family)